MRSSQAIRRQAEHGAGRVRPAQDGAPDLNTIIHALMMEFAESARVLELYYWSQEPGLVDIIRAVMALPKQSRTSVQAFLARAPDLKRVHTKVDDFGHLTLFRRR
jgi:hypothetical protein